jgi:thiol-disulfide isomerase/thioredoxin
MSTLINENNEELIENLDDNLVNNSNESSIIEESFSSYRDYDISLLSADKSNILQFHADWCPSCVTLESELNNSNIPSNLNILKVDYDNETELRKKY